MNTAQPEYENRIRPELPDPQQARADAAKTTEAAAGVTPEAVQAADIARDDDGRERPDVDKPTRGVEWVRASDLLARGSGAAARRGIDLEDRLGRSARHGIAVGAKYVGRKTVEIARKLPPLSSFGREDQTVEPRGIGRV